MKKSHSAVSVLTVKISAHALEKDDKQLLIGFGRESSQSYLSHSEPLRYGSY